MCGSVDISWKIGQKCTQLVLDFTAGELVEGMLQIVLKKQIYRSSRFAFS